MDFSLPQYYYSHAPMELAPLLCSGAGLRDAQ